MATPRKKRPETCSVCGKPPKRGELISYRGKCTDCAIAAVEANNRAMASKSGPEYEENEARRIAGMIRYAERLTSR